MSKTDKTIPPFARDGRAEAHNHVDGPCDIHLYDPVYPRDWRSRNNRTCCYTYISAYDHNVYGWGTVRNGKSRLKVARKAAERKARARLRQDLHTALRTDEAIVTPYRPRGSARWECWW